MRTKLLLPALLAALVAMTGTASAAKVGNPGTVQFIFEQGEIKIGNEVADAADPSDPITAAGVLSADSTLRFSGLSFPPIEVENTAGVGPNPIVVRVLPQQIPGQPAGVVGFGALNPNSGVATVQFRIAVKIDGFSDDCYIGTPGNPIVLNLTTETSGSQTGARYNTGNGRLTLVDGLFGVPGASGCEYAFVSVNGQINSELGLPSPSGNNYARLTARTNPIVIPAVRPSFTATPSSGVAPLSVAFDASATQSSAPVAQYRWDFTSDGTADVTSGSPTTSFTYTTPGTHQARLVVRDADGDESSTQRTIVVGTPKPDVAAALSHTPEPVITGNQATFTGQVTNSGTLATSGATTAAFALPAGWTVNGASGSGWACDAPDGGTISCSYGAALAVGETAPDLAIIATPSAPGTYTASLTAGTAGDPNASNDTAHDTASVVAAGIDLQLAKTHDLDAGFFRGRKTTYELAVSNVGTMPTTGRTRIADTLPAGVTYVGASGGAQWTCSFVAGVVRCFTDEVVDPGESLTPVRIVVQVDADAPDVVINNATVTTPAESNTANDTGTDIGNVQGYAVDYELDKAVVGTGGAPQGGQARFSIAVKNVGFGIGDNEVRVTDVLPAGLTVAGATGDGWTCASSDPQQVQCTHEGNVHAGGSLPAITVTADVAADASGTLTNRAIVESADDFTGANNEDTADVAARLPTGDLAIAKSHEGANVRVGQEFDYTLSVTNAGAEPSLGTVTVTDELPAGLQAVAISGDGWACVLATLTCTRDERVEPGATLPAIKVTVKASSTGTVVNVATVANERDADADNNRAEDPTLVIPALAPTSIEARPALLQVNLLTALTSTVLNGPEARLTSGGNPVAARELVFKGRHGGFICRARTNADGVARCGTVLITSLHAILDLGYEVAFEGDRDYEPSSAVGRVIKVNGVALL